MSISAIIFWMTFNIFLIKALVWCSHRIIDWSRDRAVRKLLNKPLLTHDEVEQIVKYVERSWKEK